MLVFWWCSRRCPGAAGHYCGGLVQRRRLRARCCCGQERIPRNLGHPKDQGEQCLAGSTAIPTSQELKTSEAKHLSGMRPVVTMLVIPQDSFYVYSGSGDRYGSARYGSPASQGSPHVVRRAQKVRGSLGNTTASFSRDWGTVLRRSLHAHKSRDQGVER